MVPCTAERVKGSAHSELRSSKGSSWRSRAEADGELRYTHSAEKGEAEAMQRFERQRLRLR